MSIYTVHQPPLHSVAAAAEPYRFVFVRDGFSWWAFLLTPFWMLRHRLWLTLVVYLLVSAALDVGLRALGGSAFTMVLAGLLISLLAGLEASTLRRFKLARRHWRNLGVVTGDDVEDAERRFYDAWIRQAPARRPPSLPSAPTSSSFPPTPPAASSGVIGLFPEPGAHR
ncbi:MAG: DUF2628 domain-containing protein [Rhizobiales bacterium]|nr:DUF2628 domain-containing protein [Hyphomicrobiales bacterium]